MQTCFIDTKFYTKTVGEYFNKTSLHSNNLYQIFSYLIQQEDGTLKSQNAIGILLYPTIEEELNLNYMYHNHKIAIRTVNLNVHWTEIHSRLIEIMENIQINDVTL
jgi:5-methylcytosine-specific restriction enzyme subunit McrC